MTDTPADPSELPGMTGTPHRVRQVPADPAEHAADFAARYAESLDYHAAQTMLDLGIDPQRIGISAPAHGIRHAAFHPHDGNGGSVSPDGRIAIDCGVMNPELLSRDYGEVAGKIWRESRLGPRMQAITAHEKAEHEAGSHEGALRLGAETELPVSHGAREILRAMERGWKGR